MRKEYFGYFSALVGCLVVSFLPGFEAVGDSCTISAFAGTGSQGVGGDGGAASSAQFVDIYGVFVTQDQNLLISEHYAVRKVEISSNIITSLNSMSGVSGMCSDTTGVLYATLNQFTSILSRVAANGGQTLVAGIDGSSGFSGDGGQATSAELDNPVSCAVDTNGDVYIADQKNNRIRKVEKTSGIISTFGGSGSTGATIAMGALTASAINTPTSVFIDTAGSLFVSESTARVYKTVLGSGQFTTYAGIFGPGDYNGGGDGGRATSASLGLSQTMTFDINGNMFISYAGSNSYARMVRGDTTIIITIAGDKQSPGDSGDGGPALSAKFGTIKSMVAHEADVYVADSTYNRVRKLSCNMVVLSTISPSASPSTTPSEVPSQVPSVVPSADPSVVPSVVPSAAPSVMPSVVPSAAPSVSPSAAPSESPTVIPSVVPTATPSEVPTATPTAVPSVAPSQSPSVAPSATPSAEPSVTPSCVPSVSPSAAPSAAPSVTPSETPSAQPTLTPTASPSVSPSATPSAPPSETPTALPSEQPSQEPSVTPSEVPTETPTIVPSATPSVKPSRTPSQVPSVRPSRDPTVKPSPKSTPEPTVVANGVNIDAGLQLNGVIIEENNRRRRLARAGSMLLMEATDNAIVTAVAAVLELPENAVSIESEHIVSNVTNVATVLVELRIFVPRDSFPSYDASFAHYTAKMNGTEIYRGLLTVAEDIGAYELYQITAVNITSLASGGVVNTAPHDDDLTAGDFSGVVIGVVVAFLVLAALVYLCISAAVGSKQSLPPAAVNHVHDDVKV